MKAHFRQDSSFCSICCAREGRNVYEVALWQKKRAPESLCAPMGSSGCIWWTTWWQLIPSHASVVSVGTDSGRTPAQKCLEVLTSARSKLSTAKMEKTISLRWEHGEPECKSPVGSGSANTLPQSSQVAMCSLNPVCMVQQSLFLHAHLYPPNCGPLICKKLI